MVVDYLDWPGGVMGVELTADGVPVYCPAGSNVAALAAEPLSAIEKDVIALARRLLAELQKMDGEPKDFVISAGTAKLWLAMIAHLAARAGE